MEYVHVRGSKISENATSKYMQPPRQRKLVGLNRKILAILEKLVAEILGK
jgi:hypothetical protein